MRTQVDIFYPRIADRLFSVLSPAENDQNNGHRNSSGDEILLANRREIRSSTEHDDEKDAETPLPDASPQRVSQARESYIGDPGEGVKERPQLFIRQS